MNDLLAKLSSYNLFNTLLPGALYCLASTALGYPIGTGSDLLANAITYYLVGVLIGRVGSIAIEPLFLRVGLTRHPSYEDFVRASASDHKIETLVETSNTYRGLLSATLCLGVSMAALAVRKMLPPSTTFDSLALLTVSIVVLGLAYRKQTGYITKRVLISMKDASSPESPRSTMRPPA